MSVSSQITDTFFRRTCDTMNLAMYQVFDLKCSLQILDRLSWIFEE